jgi:hypothetical protein
MKNDVMASAPDRHPDDLAPFLSAAKPLYRLTPEQDRKIKARALRTLAGTPLTHFRWRWTTAVAALGLILSGAAMAAAAGRYGLLPWVRVARTHSEKAQAGFAHERVRLGVPKQDLAPTPGLTVEQQSEPRPQSDEPEPAHGSRTFGLPVKKTRALSTAKSPLAFNAPSAASAPGASTRPSQLARPSEEPSIETRPAPLNEQTAMREAVRRLRQGGDAEGALTLLNELEKSHPRSLFALERSNLQVEAALTLGREKEALARLDGMALDDLPRSAERYLLRGELRARFRRWSEARDDFDHALSHGAVAGNGHERALWGRGVARLRAGDPAGGQADLYRYLATYPSGHHATEAVRLISPGP